MTTTRLEGLFAQMTEPKMREHGLEALRRCAGPHLATPVPLVIRIHWLRSLFCDVLQVSATEWNELQPELLPELTRANLPLHHYWTRHFWRWMEQAGFALRIGDPEDNGTIQNPAAAILTRWAISDTGVRLLKNEHPSRPGVMLRLRTAYGATHEHSLNRLEDATSCFEHGLYRSAVVMLGLSYEELFKVLTKQLGVTVKWQASDQQDEVRKFIDHAPNGASKTSALCAFPIADVIRDKRNVAAHRAASAWDSVEVDELLVNGVNAYASLAGYTL